ncbi:YceI family protein [Acidobacteria bacterium AH-259-G07]|nr:YceI family protein [Acidobacteria bacterium AH-259-G07]
MKNKAVLGLIFSLILISHCLAQQIYQIDSKESIIKIHLDTGGFLGFLGDEHFIEAPIARGKITYYPDDVEKSSVELEVVAKQIAIRDPHLSEEDRKEVQQTMASGRVLYVDKYPRVIFKSSMVRKLKDGRLGIVGDLTVRGETKEVQVLAKIEATEPRLHVSGRSRFKQTEFGIKPVTAGAGTVRVKDEIELSFRVYFSLP